jgi:uncharacterized protein (DUF58 family)
MIYIAVSIFLGVVAVNSGNNLLYLGTAVLLGYMLASGLAGRSNIRDASVSLSFPDEIYAQVPCAVVVHVHNKNRFVPLFLIEVALAEGKKRVFFPVVQPKKTESRSLFATFSSRGPHEVENVELSSVYPFNFFVRYWPVPFKTSVTVFPYPLPCDPELLFVRALPRGEEDESATPAAPAEETDIVGVRPYMEGDPIKRVHWKSSARTGRLQSRLYEGAAVQSGRIIDLDRLTAGDVERGLSMAAYAVTESMKSGLAIGMRVRQEILPPAPEFAHKKNLLTRLALYE